MNPRHEPATDRTWEEQLYLAANRDVARHVANGGDAWTHWDRHGRAEGRHQLRPAEAGLQGTRMERKWRRFAPLLDAGRGAGGAFRWLAGEGALPVAYGGPTHALADYHEGESANPGLGAFVDAVRGDPDGLYLEVGCGRRTRCHDNCLYLDVYPSPSADVVMEPACRYPIADASLDGLGCFAVLEHVTEPWTAAAEFRRMLKPGGTLFVDWPFLVPVHGYPSHYYNATREGLVRLFDESFERVSLDTLPNQTPDQALHWQLRDLLAALPDAERGALATATVGELLAEAPGTGRWARAMSALPDAAKARLGAGSTLVAKRR